MKHTISLKQVSNFNENQSSQNGKKKSYIPCLTNKNYLHNILLNKGYKLK